MENEASALAYCAAQQEMTGRLQAQDASRSGPQGCRAQLAEARPHLYYLERPPVEECGQFFYFIDGGFHSRSEIRNRSARYRKIALPGGRQVAPASFGRRFTKEGTIVHGKLAQ